MKKSTVLISPHAAYLVRSNIRSIPVRSEISNSIRPGIGRDFISDNGADFISDNGIPFD